jgi:hypothetical protein
MAARRLSVTHLHQISWHFDLYFESYDIFFGKYKICHISDKYWIDLESLGLKGPQVGNMFTSV